MSAFDVVWVVAGGGIEVPPVDRLDVEVVVSETAPPGDGPRIVVVRRRDAVRIAAEVEASGVPTVLVVDGRLPWGWDSSLAVTFRWKDVWAAVRCLLRLDRPILQEVIDMNQLGPSVSGVTTYDIEGDSGELGHLVVAGLCPGSSNVPPFTAAWSWDDPSLTAFPDRFRLAQNATGTVDADDGAWTFEDTPFPQPAHAALEGPGFVSHTISRTKGGGGIARFHNRTDGTVREQYWTTRRTELDGDRLLKNRGQLYFSVTTAPATGHDECHVTTRPPAVTSHLDGPGEPEPEQQ